MFDKLIAFLNSQTKEQNNLFEELRIEKVKFLENVLHEYLQFFYALQYPASDKWIESFSKYKNAIQLKDVRIPIIDFNKPLEKQLNDFWTGIFQDDNMQIKVFRSLLSKDFRFISEIDIPIVYLQMLLIYYTYLVPEMPNKAVSRIDFITTKVVAYAFLTIGGIQSGAGHIFRTEKSSKTIKNKKAYKKQMVIEEYYRIDTTGMKPHTIARTIRENLNKLQRGVPSVDAIKKYLGEDDLI